ncbi:MAG: C25 family cysteine peptidase [Planctomycetota bacterium]
MKKVVSSLLLAIALAVTTSSGFAQRPSEVPRGTVAVVAGTADSIALEARAGALAGRVIQLPAGRFLDLQRPAGTTTEVGTPALPVQRILVEVPFGARDVRVEIQQEEWTERTLAELGSADFLFPVQPPLPKIPDARANARFHWNRSAYAEDAFAPETTVRVEEAGILRGHRLLSVAVHPIQYNPRQRALRVLDRMAFQIHYRDADLAATARIQQRYGSPFFAKILADHVANRSAVTAPADEARRGGLSASISLPVGYLVIVPDVFVSSIQPLADAKEHIGYTVTVAPTSVTGSTAAQIKNYIQLAYDTWPVPPQFVLLVGDSNYIPGFQGSETYSITDLDYACLAGADYFPDVFLGRFAVRSTTQIQDVLAKVLYYEGIASTSQPWIKKGAFMASTDNYTISEGTHNYVISYYLDPAGYVSDKLYTVTYGATTQDVIDSLNAGRSLAVYSGHGYELGWSDGPPFDQANINSLVNLEEYPIVCSHACLTGDYETTECFGETWQRAPGKGGVMFWGASTYSYWDEDDILEKGMFESAFGDGTYFVTGMTNEGLLSVFNYYGGGGLSRYYYQEYNVLGEPSMFLRTAEPAIPVVTHDAALPVGAAVLSVTVFQGGSPVPGALVHAAKDPEVFASAYTDATGFASIAVSTTTPGSMDLVVSGHNLVIYEDVVTIFVPTGPYVVLDDHVVDDSAGGNGDGDVDVGETIELPVAGLNVGSSTAYGVVATLGTSDPLVTITDATETLGDIATGAVVWTPDDFDFAVAANGEDGHIVPFTVTFTDSGSNVWDYALNLVVNAPKLVQTSTTVTEVTGNGDNWPDPGESLSFEVTLRNDGHHVAEDISVELHTLDPHCTVTQGISAYVDLLPGASAANIATLTADIGSGCPGGHDVVVNVDIYRGADLAGTAQFSFAVGEIPVLLVDLDANHNSAPAIEAALTAFDVTYEKTLSWPASFAHYDSLFVCLGIYSSNTVLSSAQANALVAFMQGGGNVYMEGGDCWAYDSYASIYCDDFGINGLDDGTSDTGTILGQAGTFAAGMSLQYAGDNDWMDHISARTGAVLILKNYSPSYGNGVAYDKGTYRSIGVSFEFGGIADGPGGTQLGWMRKILRFLDIRARATWTFWPL